MTDTTPIVFSTDENYYLYTCAAIQSILNTAKSPVLIYVMVDKDLSPKIKEKLAGLGERKGDAAGVLDVRHKVSLIYMDNRDFDDIKISKKIYTVAILYRLVLCKVLPQYDRCLYLDSDILVTQDLSELLNMDMGEYLCAGAKDIGMHRNFHWNLVNIGVQGVYVNSGVLLMNLAEWRRSSMCERVIDECQRNVFRWTDQDAINKCCAGRILRFSGKFNYIPFFTELEEDVEPAIIHYADKNQGIRPWIYTRIKGADMWLDCARQVFDEEEFKKVLSDAEMITENWNNILRVCDEYETRYVWGLGEDGRYLVDALKFNKFKLRGIIESDVTKVGTTYQGVPVISADDVPDRSDVLVIISSWKCHEDILEAMKDKGIRNVRKEFFNRKRKPYYKLIDKKFYGVELRELLEQQGILEHVEGGAHGSETVGFLQ